MSEREGNLAKYPVNQNKKDFIKFFFIGSIILSMLIYFNIENPQFVIPDNLPEIHIKFSGQITTEEYIDCEFRTDCKYFDCEFVEGEYFDPIDAKIRIRGTSITHFPKKGYRLELSQQKSLLDMRKDDDWNLFAMYLDFPRTRVKLSFDLWRSLLPTDPYAIAPRCKYVHLYLNGRFQGLYLLAEKNDRRLFHLDDGQNNINSSLLFQAKGSVDFRTYISEAWEQDYPNEDEGIYIMDDILTNLFDFINNTSDSTFFNETIGIYSKFDKQNLIDFFVFNHFIYHDDSWNNNFFLVRNTHPSKFFLFPWDFDGSFGQNKFYLFDYDAEEIDFIKENNELYNRLLNNADFMKNCSERWFDLRKELWSKRSILRMLDEMYDDISDTLGIEYYMWTHRLMDKEDNYEYIDILYDWISDRLKYCDSYFYTYL